MDKSAFLPTEILIPSIENMEAWSVVACDQFTSERDYWERVAERTSEALSTFHMIMPEAFLNEVSPLDAAVSAAAVMEKYIDADVFEALPDSFVYVEREVTGGVRRGLVGAIDLEAYDYSPEAKARIRASEKTVTERLPVRTMIRESAALELPHAMVLIDDPEKTVVEPLHSRTASMRKVYDFELMEGGGRIKGWQVTGEDAERVLEAFKALSGREMELVVGDGNHSLAAAKEVWDKIKLTAAPEELENHPARYALCELNNVYDDGVKFEPIHRVVFNIDPEKMIEVMREKLTAPEGHTVTCVVNGTRRESLTVRGKNFGSMIEIFQDFLEEYAAFNEGTIDYIHDEDALLRVTEEEGSIGFLLPAMGKDELFKTVLMNGVFPKKSFSIGHARDKRYYLECRKIK